MLSMILILAAASLPAERFARANPGSQRVAISSGEHLVHASGFRAETGALRAGDAARAFLASWGSAFGVTGRQVLTVLGEPRAGEAGAVRLGRTLDGLPVFGGDVSVGVDGQGRVFLVNANAVPAAVSGAHSIGEAAALQSARASFDKRLRGAGPASVTAGWRAFGNALRAVYRVDFIASAPAGDWRIFVDGETGRTLFRQDLRFYASAPGSVFEISPTETQASLCPLSGSGGHLFCANPTAVTLSNLITGASLIGSQTSVYNCAGADAPASASSVPGPCREVFASGGAFNFMSDSTWQSLSDDFSAAMAYYQLDRHVDFFKKLDPALPPPLSAGRQGRALRESLPALVNARENGNAYENAYFSGGLDAMVFGQGARADYAYDATVAYHELTHGVVFAWGGFDFGVDGLGALDEPSAVNEGTADAMTVSQTGRSALGSFIEATKDPPGPFLRDLADSSASRTCQGDGTLVNRYGASVANGMDGESHEDGQIWGSFFWEVSKGLEDAGVKACGGGCEAGPALQYKALQLAGGTNPTFASYWLTFKAAASALFPAQPKVADYVECVAQRRHLDQCDRTVGLYSGERRVQYVRLRYSPFQVVVHASGETQLDVCSLRGTASTLYGRLGEPVQLIGGGGGQAEVIADGSVPFSQRCSAGTFQVNLSPGGDWYLLVDSPNALVGADPGTDVYRFDAGSTGMAQRPFASAPDLCFPPSVLPLVWPRDALVPPRGSLQLTATGGSGTGYTWSFASNLSGASIGASGLYTAGSTGGVTDVIRVTDSGGAAGTRSISVGPQITIAGSPASIPPRGSLGFTATGGSGTGFQWSLGDNGSGGSIDSASGAYQAGAKGSTSDVVKVVDSLGNTATSAVTITAGVSIAPASVSLAPGATQTFTAAGGSGTGYAWSLSASPSGGSIDPGSGAYKAGSKSGSDRVRATDSLGNEAEATVTVGSSGGCSSAGVSAGPALALLAALLLRRLRARGRG